MVNKKLVLCVLALSMLTAPVAQSFTQQATNSLITAKDWFLNQKRTWLKDGIEQPHDMESEAVVDRRFWQVASNDDSTSRSQESVIDSVSVAAPISPDKDTKKNVWTYKNNTSDLPSQKILGIPLVPNFMGQGFKCPLEFVTSTVFSSFLGKLISGKASLKEHGKFALWSVSGALVASLVKLAEKHSVKKLTKSNSTKSIKAVKSISLFFQILPYLAGQNPDQVQAIWKSFTDENVKKDLTDFICSLDEDARLFDRLAALTRNVGPIALNAF